MKVIYEPKGRAREYAKIACNLYTGCSHGCKYCYAPACLRKGRNEFHGNVAPRKDIIKNLEKDAASLPERYKGYEILFCFTTDPYQPLEASAGITRQALEIAKYYGLHNKILTKGRIDLIRRDLQLMKEARTNLGVTICFTNDALRKEWEPNASPIEERFELLKEAHSMGIETWVSLEPVIDPDQALSVIRKAAPYVDSWMIGKLNHMKEIEDKVDWYIFFNNLRFTWRILEQTTMSKKI